MRWERLLSLAMVAAICWQLAQWTWLFMAPPASKPAIAPGAAHSTEQMLENVHSAHLFGASSGKTEQPQTATSLNLRLSGVFAADGKLPAIAIIRIENRGDLPFLSGDKVLPGVMLEQVRPDHVVLRRGAVAERLDLEQKAAPQGAKSTAAPLNVRSEGPGKFSVTRDELTKILSDPAQLAGIGQVKAVAGQGLRIEGAEPGGLVQRLGLKQGDVVRRINDRYVEQASDLLQGYRDQLSMGGTITVQGTRNGQPFEYNYNLK